MSSTGISYSTVWETAERCWVKDAAQRPDTPEVVRLLKRPLERHDEPRTPPNGLSTEITAPAEEHSFIRPGPDSSDSQADTDHAAAVQEPPAASLQQASKGEFRLPPQWSSWTVSLADAESHANLYKIYVKSELANAPTLPAALTHVLT